MNNISTHMRICTVNACQREGTGAGNGEGNFYCTLHLIFMYSLSFLY